MINKCDFGSAPCEVGHLCPLCTRRNDEAINMMNTAYLKGQNKMATTNEYDEEGLTLASATECAMRIFNAYNAQGPNPNKTWDGKEVPPWHLLGTQVQNKWIAAAHAADKYLVGE